MKTIMPILPVPALPAGPAAPAARVATVDEHGDAIFRFRLRPGGGAADPSLDEFYRAQLYDLLTLVRLYAGTTPLLIDGFAFRNEPERIHPLQPRCVDSGPR